MDNRGGEKMHFVLVHGACHGAWSWYKVATLLTAAGHRVTAPDLAACGADARRLHEVGTFLEYSRPLMEVMDALPPGERVVLVGHSFGGMSAALAMERYPEKIAAAIFVSAFVPDTSSRPSHVLDELLIPNALPARFREENSMHLFKQCLCSSPSVTCMHKFVKRYPLPCMDVQLRSLERGPNKPVASLLFGPQFLSSKLYQLCSPEDITLALSLIREGSLFQEDLSSEPPFSEERYGSVKKVYVLCDEDLAIPMEFQLWMAEGCAIYDVKVVKGAGHVPMFSKPQELCQHLMDVANVYA